MADLSDFDFDELDKAVAGALSDTPQETEPALDDTPVVAPKEEVTKPVAPSAAPAYRRSSGRFMDVVHPSSDMRTKPSGFTPPVNSQPVVANKPEAVTRSEDEEKDDWAKPLESPFLADAKVEKRPLGTMPGTGDTLKEDELLLEAPDEPLIEAHAMPDPIDFAAQTSALSSEQEDTGAPVETVEEEIAFVEPEVTEEVAEVPAEVEATSEVSEAHEETAPVKADEPVGPASISQQYTEQPSTTPESGAIYDTESYHQPLAPAPKKKSGALVFVWILLLVIVGAAAGVGFYLFILPTL